MVALLDIVCLAKIKKSIYFTIQLIFATVRPLSRILGLNLTWAHNLLV